MSRHGADRQGGGAGWRDSDENWQQREPDWAPGQDWEDGTEPGARDWFDGTPSEYADPYGAQIQRQGQHAPPAALPPADGYGSDGYGSDGYRRDGYGTGGYAAPDQYGADGYGAADPYAPGDFGQAGQYGTGPYGQGWPAEPAVPGGSYPPPGGPPVSYPPGSYPPADYPSAEFPSGHYPATDYPSAEFPSAQFPAAQYPAADYPGADYPSAEYPAAGGYPEPDPYGQFPYPGGPAGPQDPASGTFRWPSPGAPEDDLTGGAPDGTERSTRGLMPGADRYAQWSQDPDDGAWDGNAVEADEDDWDNDDDLISRLGGDDDEDGGRPGRRGGRDRRGAGRPRPRKRGRRVMTTLVLLVIVGVLGGVVGYGYDYAHNWFQKRYGDYTGPGTGTVKFTVPAGASAGSLAPALVSAGVIMETRPFLNAANSDPRSNTLQPGIYRLHHDMNAALALQLLLSSKARINNNVTIPEGLRAIDIARRLHTATGKPLSDFTSIMDHPAQLGLPSYANGKVEGFLFPSTYAIGPSETPLKLLQTMVAEFKTQAASVGVAAGASRIQITQRQVIIMASLVQAEGGTTADFGKIARVIINRLYKVVPAMKLQLDSTVFYGLGIYGTAASFAQTHKPTPYNTYLNYGLPPGPIDSPGAAAIHAVLNATKGNWLYFIASGKGGSSQFFDTYAEMQAWQQTHKG